MGTCATHRTRTPIAAWSGSPSSSPRAAGRCSANGSPYGPISSARACAPGSSTPRASACSARYGWPMATSERAATQESISAIAPVERRDPPRRARDEDYDLFFNRETSWMRFNERVLELAEDESVPLLERVKFCAIYTSNPDEFFMIRVAFLHDLVAAGVSEPLADGRSPSETIDRIREKALEHQDRLSRTLRDDLVPTLAENGVRIVDCAEVDEAGRVHLAERFERQIFPVLTPLAIGLGR